MDEGDGRAAATVFDALGADYERAFGRSAAHRASLHRLLGDLAPHSRILDIGSGTGRPTALTLTGAGHEVLGVDVSPVMVDLAARNVPGASFQCADIRELPLEESGFDAVCAYFSLLQMSREEQFRLLRTCARLLVPGGHLVVATVPLDVEDVDVVFMGHRVRATSFGPEEFTELVTAAGFSVLWEQSTLFTPECEAGVAEPQLFLHCRRA
ncbi:class I SAM-dependent methyltransferase [Streptomyces sp. NPDC051992]|uniref:class I SAM-dependent methyltransferase n=1 Tax=Streptomyces sp. NPDC051992 TaxID=3161012 RepID=UPI0034341ACA